MSRRAYLIAYYDLLKETISGFIIASEFPVTHMGGDYRQLLVHKTCGDDYGEAERQMVGVLESSKYLRWVLDYPIRGLTEGQRSILRSINASRSSMLVDKARRSRSVVASRDAAKEPICDRKESKGRR